MVPGASPAPSDRNSHISITTHPPVKFARHAHPSWQPRLKLTCRTQNRYTDYDCSKGFNPFHIFTKFQKPLLFQLFSLILQMNPAMRGASKED